MTMPATTDAEDTTSVMSPHDDMFSEAGENSGFKPIPSAGVRSKAANSASSLVRLDDATKRLALPISSRLKEFPEPLRLELRVGRVAVGYGE